MPSHGQVIEFLGYVVVAAPLLMTVLLGISTLLDWKLTERTITESLQMATIAGLAAAVAILILMLSFGTRHVPIDLGDWVVIPGHTAGEGYAFSIKFLFDRLSVPLVILSFVLSGTIGAFASNYMHRERGFNRFFALYALFVLGMVVTSLAGNIETLFAGWEFVGLSSALLVAFFQERPAPVRNGLWVWVIYRVADAAFLLAAVVMMHMAGRGDFDLLTGAHDTLSWPGGQVPTTVSSETGLIVGFLLLIAAAGKSALVPFSGWLPRAMEGPTPSSAVFYGALSVHLGAFLLLRMGPLLDSSLWLAGAVIILGLTTAVYAYLVGSVQTDIKSALSFASVLQVGIIVAEIGVAAIVAGIGRTLASPFLLEVGIHLRYVPLVHLLGHACLRTLQFIRAPTLLLDIRTLENAIGARLPRPGGPVDYVLSARTRTWLYRFGLERGYLDTVLADYIVSPIVRLLRWCDALERRWTDFLSGRASRESDAVRPYSGSFDELP